MGSHVEFDYSRVGYYVEHSHRALMRVAFSTNFPSYFVLFPLFSSFYRRVQVRGLFRLFLDRSPLFRGGFPSELTDFCYDFYSNYEHLMTGVQTRDHYSSYATFRRIFTIFTIYNSSYSTICSRYVRYFFRDHGKFGGVAGCGQLGDVRLRLSNFYHRNGNNVVSCSIRDGLTCCLQGSQVCLA